MLSEMTNHVFYSIFFGVFFPYSIDRNHGGSHLAIFLMFQVFYKDTGMWIYHSVACSYWSNANILSS
jgi:hypothetical protein